MDSEDKASIGRIDGVKNAGGDGTGPAKDRQKPRRMSSLGMTAAACVVFGAAMLGAAFASVPLYRIFCQVTGYGGTTQRAESAPDTVSDRVVTVRFDANIANGVGWAFRPEQREMKVKLGELAHATFFAENRGDTTTTASAIFNVSPDRTGAFFNKIACFCFTSQTLKPGEKVELPVTFFVDPAMDRDSESRYTDTITLSYTFYPSTEPATPPVASIAPAATDTKLR